MKELNLSKEDHYCLTHGLELTDRIVNASQVLMKQQFGAAGLQNTLFGQSLKFKPVKKTPTDACIVQILHTGRTDRPILMIHKPL